MRIGRLRTGEIIVLLIIMLSFGLAIFYYPRLPTHIPYHINSQGRVIQGYPSKFFLTFGISILISGISLIYMIVPRLRSKITDERFHHYDRLLIWLLTFWILGQLHGLVTGFLLLSFNQTKIVVMIVFATLFFLLGDTFAHAKKGWFVSIRNRWTLNQPPIWVKTHRNVGLSFKAAAIFCLFQMLLPMPYMVYPIGVCLCFALYYVFLYSYFANRKYKKETIVEARQNIEKDK
jgi:uncharacterized membrane protein